MNFKCLFIIIIFGIFINVESQNSGNENTTPKQVDSTTQPQEPTQKPQEPTQNPTNKPTNAPTNKPTNAPTNKPTDTPIPSQPTEPPAPITDPTSPPKPTTTSPPKVGTEFFEDTTFELGFNGWDIEGTWGKYKASYLGMKPNPKAKDEYVLLTSDVSGSALKKNFTSMVNAKIILTYYINCTTEVIISGETVSAMRTNQLFNLSRMEVNKLNGQWFANTIDIKHAKTPFMVKLNFKGKDSNLCRWAIDAITVAGKHSDTVAEPPTEKPTIGEPTTEQPGPSNTTKPPTQPPSTEEPPDYIKEMTRLSRAMWDAFYVFVALFCACILLLVVLIFYQKRRNR